MTHSKRAPTAEQVFDRRKWLLNEAAGLGRAAKTYFDGRSTVALHCMKATLEDTADMLSALQAEREALEARLAAAEENWQALIDAPELTPERVAEIWFQNERTNNTIPSLDEYDRSGLLTRLASVIGRARVDGGIAAQKLVALEAAPPPEKEG